MLEIDSVKTTIQNITGANYRGDRVKDDFYATPLEVTQAVIPKLNIPKDKIVWEPCAGDGAIVKALAKEGYIVCPTDIVDRNCPGAMVGPYWDATICKAPTPMPDVQTSCKYIVTNPPWNLADKILKNLLDQEPEMVAMLLKSHWLQAGSKRGWIMDECPPTNIYALSWRPDWTGKGSPTGEAAWFVWRRHYAGPFSSRPPAMTTYEVLKYPKNSLLDA